jgi:tRNA U54 and U55 pseudouridine synthase Pus10
MALLRTCRQIYAESALVPLMSTMFSFRYVDHAGRVLRMFKAHQRKHITTIEFQMFHPNHDYSLCEGTFLNSRVSLPKLLPGLKELHVRVFCVPSLEENDTQKTEAKLQQLLNPQVEGMEVDIKVEETQLTPHEYYKEYVRPKPYVLGGKTMLTLS